MTVGNSVFARVVHLEKRIEKLKAEIVDHEMIEHKQNYEFYSQGAFLYKLLEIYETELTMKKELLQKENGA